MDDWDLRLLEYTAIRHETSIDYKVWQEFISGGVFPQNYFPNLKDLDELNNSFTKCTLSERTQVLTDDAIRNSDKVKRAVERYAGLINSNDIRILYDGGKYYPDIWKNLSGMPRVIFVKGDVTTLCDLDHNGGASIVGSRSPGRYALYATKEFSSRLSTRGVVIVSGMALGIDRQAHEACINAGGKTIAVLPGGCDVVYPYQNNDLYDRICENGVVLSELPPGQEIIKQYFPSRNRLISALSDVCMIMEAGEYSGTLHTASFAASQSRDVFVLPNSIYAENSIGGLKLLRDGAEVLIDVDTVYERIREEVGNRAEYFDYDPVLYDAGSMNISELRDLSKKCPDRLEEKDWKVLVLDELSEKPKNIDELCLTLGIPFSYLSALVTSLEIEGRIANEKGKYVLTINGC